MHLVDSVEVAGHEFGLPLAAWLAEGVEHQVHSGPEVKTLLQVEQGDAQQLFQAQFVVHGLSELGQDFLVGLESERQGESAAVDQQEEHLCLQVVVLGLGAVVHVTLLDLLGILKEQYI